MTHDAGSAMCPHCPANRKRFVNIINLSFWRRKDESFLAAIFSFQVQLMNGIIWDYHYFSFVKLVRVYSNASDRI